MGTGVKLGVLASGGGTILQAILDAGLPVPVVVDRPARGGRSRAGGAGRRRRRGGRPVGLPARPRAPSPTPSSTPCKRHDVDLVAMAGFMTILAEPIFDGVPRPGRQHPPGAAAVVQGLARGARRAGRRREGHRLHRAPGHAPRSTPGRSWPRRPSPSSPATPRTRCTSASRRSSAASTRRS